MPEVSAQSDLRQPIFTMWFNQPVQAPFQAEVVPELFLDADTLQNKDGYVECVERGYKCTARIAEDLVAVAVGLHA